MRWAGAGGCAGTQILSSGTHTGAGRGCEPWCARSGAVNELHRSVLPPGHPSPPTLSTFQQHGHRKLEEGQVLNCYKRNPP